MDAILHVATLLTKKFDYLLRSERQIALVHRAARDCFTTINLALINPKVALSRPFSLEVRGEGTNVLHWRLMPILQPMSQPVLRPVLQPMICNNGD